MRAAGLRRPRLRACCDRRRPHVPAVLALLLLQPAERARLRRARGRLGVRQVASTPTAPRRSRPTRSTATASAAPGRAASRRRRAGGLRRARVPRLVLRVGRHLARPAPRRHHRRRRLSGAPDSSSRHAVDAVHGVAGTLGRVTRGARSAPRRQTMWVDPARFHAEAVACTVAAGAPPAPTATAVPAPAVRVTAEGGSLRVQRSFDALPAARGDRFESSSRRRAPAGRILSAAAGFPSTHAPPRTSWTRRAAPGRSRSK